MPKKSKIKKIEPMKIDINSHATPPQQIKLKDELKNDKKIKPSKIFEKYNEKSKVKKSSKNGSI
jgi:hypothetical protein